MSLSGAVGSLDERRAQGVIELSVPDLERSLAFYTRLGFDVERRHAGFASLTGYGCRLFLAHDTNVSGLPDRRCNLRIVVDDVDTIRALAERIAAPITRELADRGYGLRDFSVLDPSGFGLRFAQLLS
jgi:catechol 2,3-dioxygenase-like lactoylglutathione lyase family enzyme